MPLSFDNAVAVSQLWPEIILVLAACAVLLLGLSPRGMWRSMIPWVAAAALVTPLLLMLVVSAEPGIGGGLSNSALAAYVRKIVFTIGFVLLLVNWSQPAAHERGEFFAMMLFSLAGLTLTALADDLLMLFLALELVSIPTYIMVTLSRLHPRGLEAGTKYFYLGAMSAAITAFGFSYLYGVSGTASMSDAVDLHTVASALTDPRQSVYAMAMIGLVLSIGGILFKLAAVPLHFYVADVYQGAASPVAGFLGFVPKLAGVIALVRVLQLTAGQHSEPLFWLLWIIAAASMTVGNVLALWQTNVKRMLAYSGIAHSGYMLVAVLASWIVYGSTGVSNADSSFARTSSATSISGLSDGLSAVLYYVAVYGIANLTAFAVLALLRVRGEPCENLRDLAGLLRRQPALALLMALAMFTLIGLPPTAGFWGKMGLFGSALAASGFTTVLGHTTVTGQPMVAVQALHQSWMIALVIIGVLNSAVGVAYYLRVAAACLLYENDKPADAIPHEIPRMGAVLCGFLLLIFAFAPSVLFNAARTATAEYRPAITPPPSHAGSKPSPSENRDLPTIPAAEKRAAGFSPRGPAVANKPQ